MSEPVYNIVFFGIIAPGKDKAVVMDHMAKLFRTTTEKVAPYFNGGRKVIKAAVDGLTAEKYRTALENIGLIIKLEDADTAPTQADNSPKVAAIETGGITMAEPGADVIEHPVETVPQPIGDISGITTARLGADVLEHPIEVKPQHIGDISGITVAEPGADVLEHPIEVEPQPIGDISGLTVAEPGADMLEHPDRVESRPIDGISDISLAEVGADIIENPRPKEKAAVPDTSDLSIAKN
jgi:hypothetical protein